MIKCIKTDARDVILKSCSFVSNLLNLYIETYLRLRRKFEPDLSLSPTSSYLIWNKMMNEEANKGYNGYKETDESGWRINSF